ncbi:hypothetical protein [Aquimarina brevivitae]|uniref:Transglutaminase superfamily protein n=1 Tax=Aquimarina brevivitae TaxID=323412 RepID=A0A4Q7PHM0_9FLAO|nr:hypothetical protein [Aquimarina brevivitae]RZS99647.1 hypothetical protein EV197_0870 [Aquimarina brevivitae]
MASKGILGCFGYLSILLVAVVGSTFFSAITGISFYYSFLVCLFLLSWLIERFLNSGQEKRSSRYILYSIIITILVFVFNSAFQQNNHTSDYSKDIAEEVYKEQILEKGDSITLLSHQRSWLDNYGKSYQGVFSVRQQDYNRTKNNYATYSRQINPKTWQELYQYHITTDTPSLDLIIASLDQIRQEQNLNPMAFAEMVVTFVQDIPYSFVFNEACQSADTYVESIQKILKQCPECCIGEIPYGIQNPTGFMGNLKGDCDTRTVFIYAILSHFGYDVAILNSDFYQHSILGLNIPASGTYKTYHGKRYYVWETTNKSYTIGTLPKNVNNINHWYFVLTKTN